ncbi:MAG: FAD-binding oxidoreductase [Deltaproteobacteria bacterium]|nr:FAD-binding oxidoreductase [Deltaproteobacteria bacterium]
MNAPFSPTDAAAEDSLLEALRAAVGQGFVVTSEADTFAYRRDLWPRLTVTARDGLPEVSPLAVVRPADEAEVEAVVAALAEHDCPIVAYGAGSGVCGGAAPLFGGVVVDLKRLDDLSPVDEHTMQVDVGPGLILQTMEERLNDAGWTLGHFPSSIYCCSIGGCVAARGAGQLSSRYGKIEDMVTGLRVVTPGLGTVGTGSLDPSGPRADYSPLFVGSEGTLGLITSMRLRVHPLPKAMVLRGVQFPSVEAGIAAFREILQMGLRPSVMRLYDPLDTWMAMQKGNDPGQGPAPRPGGGTPLDVQSESPRENAAEPTEAPPEDAGTARLFGMVLSPGSIADEALSRLERLPGLGRFARDRRTSGERRGGTGRGGGRRATDGPQGVRGMLVRTLAARLMGDEAALSLKPENLPMDRLLAYAAPLNRAIDLLPGRSLAILGFEGDDEVARGQLEAAILAAGRLGGKDLGPGPGERWFRTRYHVSFKLPKLLQSGAWADTMETAAGWTKVMELYQAVRRAAAPHALVMAHFSHAYHEGCSIYFTLAGHASTPEERLAQYDQVWRAVLTAAEGTGATITHHHGVGFLKRQLMDREHGDGRALFDASKRALDPRGVLNPGKLFPPEKPAPGPIEEAPPAKHLVVHAHEDGVIEAGTDWLGVDLASELHLRGHFLPPLGRAFLENTVEDWVRSGAHAAYVAVHGAWEHPLQGVSGRLPDGRRWRSGRLPRSAAGPSWLPFGQVGDELIADTLTFRTLTPPPMRHVGFLFEHMDDAIAATRDALRGAVRPLGGTIYRGKEPRGFRQCFSRAPRPREGGVVYLAFGWPDGFPQGIDAVIASLTGAGGQPLPDEDGLAWWEDHWGQPQREGASTLPNNGPAADEALIGRCSAIVPWGRAQTLLRAVETLTGGPTDAVGVVEAPLETGCTVRWRFFSSRPQQPTSHLVLHQLRQTIASFGARIEELDFPNVEDAPPGAFDSTPEAPSDFERLSESLLREVTA